jgi:hypothetical protein
LGKRVQTVLDSRRSAGSHTIEFDGSRLASGIYFYRIQARDPETSSGQGFVDVKKMILMK